MSAETTVAAPPIEERTDVRPIFVAAGIMALLILFLQRVPGAGLAPGGQDGSWLAGMIMRLADALPSFLSTNATLTAVAVAFMSLLIARLYEGLLYNDWSTPAALTFVAALTCNAVIVSTVASSQWAIAMLVACILVVPGIRRIESVGDVQANMSFGLILPLLVLAGPATAPLVPVLALLGPLADRDARHDIRAVIAMYLVAIMPTLLLLAGMAGMFGLDEMVGMVVPSRAGNGSIASLVTIAIYMILPFVLLIGAYMFTADRRRQPLSAAAVLALPFWLILGAVCFGWAMPPSLPLVALFGGFASWLSVARLKPNYRHVALALLILTAALSWSPKILPLIAG